MTTFPQGLAAFGGRWFFNFKLMKIKNLYVDCWTSGNPGIGGGRVVNEWGDTLKKFCNNDPKNKRSNNFYELYSIDLGITCAEHAIDGECYEACKIFSDSKVALGWIKKNPSPKILNYEEVLSMVKNIRARLFFSKKISLEFWESRKLGEIPADYGRKKKKRF